MMLTRETAALTSKGVESMIKITIEISAETLTQILFAVWSLISAK